VRVAVANVAGISPDDIVEQDVGPTWGSQISAKAIQGLVIFLVLVAIYIGFRFEVKMAGSALAALVHDLIITAGIYALVGREVTPAAVIAILTILGYSLYDTVVIFDKIKENTDQAALVARETYGGVVNISLNQTLMRSVNTSLVVLLPIGSLLLFGGSTLKDFAFALFVGVAVGTYSSIFVASPILVTFKEREPKYQQIRTRATQRAAAGKPSAAVKPAPSRPVTPVRASQSRAGQTKGSPRPVQAVPASGNGEVAIATGNGQATGDGAVAAQPVPAPAATSARPTSGASATARKKPGAKPKPKRRRR
jgi:preprotein translocase subunit SecF